MNIHQFNIQYLPAEDRLLFRLNTTDHQVILLMFTRRLVKSLIGSLDAVIETMPLTTLPEKALPPSQETKKAISQFEHESVVQKSDFTTPFEEKVKAMPLGEAPILLTSIQIKKVGASQLIMTFLGVNKPSISLNMNEKILHSFYHLIAQASQSAEWNLNFGLKGANASAIPEAFKERLN